MKRKLIINRNIIISEKSPTFIIAEIGINHSGSYNKCKKMIREFSKSGANAVKLQTINIEESYAKNTLSYREFKDKDFSTSQLNKLRLYTEKFGLTFLSTPGDFSSYQKLKKSGVKIFKISSGLFTNLPLINTILKDNFPLIISTGMASKREIDDLYYKLIKKTKNFSILKCTSLYPNKDIDVNLNNLDTFLKSYNVLIGYSDHTLDEISSIGAVVKGAKIIEKHVTLNKKEKGGDHKISLEPSEFKTFVNKIRRMESQLGRKEILPTMQEIKKRTNIRRFIVAKTNLNKDEKVTYQNILFKRLKNYKNGFSPNNLDLILGRSLKNSISKNKLITKKDIL